VIFGTPARDIHHRECLHLLELPRATFAFDQITLAFLRASNAILFA
jgi:hypothetical protein